MNYSREARCLLDHAAYTVERIISCYKQRFGNLFDDQNRFDVSVNLDEGDCVLFDVVCHLNCNVWRSPSSKKSKEDAWERHFSLFIKIFNRYQEIEILEPITDDGITERFLSIVRYGIKYFNLINVGSLKFWPNILRLKDENLQWR